MFPYCTGPSAVAPPAAQRVGLMSAMTKLKVCPEFLRGITAPPDRRRYKRFGITLLGRYMRTLTKQEATCRLVDISIGGASLLSDMTPQPDELVIIYFDEIGGLEGTVTRTVAGGFAVKFSASHRRRQKLAAQLTWLINRHELAPADQRRAGHERITVAPKPVRIEMEDGTVIERNLFDVSIPGGSIDATERPPIGSKITLGRLSAKVVRHHDRGIGVEFSRIQQFNTIREDFG